MGYFIRKSTEGAWQMFARKKETPDFIRTRIKHFDKTGDLGRNPFENAMRLQNLFIAAFLEKIQEGEQPGDTEAFTMLVAGLCYQVEKRIKSREVAPELGAQNQTLARQMALGIGITMAEVDRLWDQMRAQRL